MPDVARRTILLLGAEGQVGWQLRTALASLGSVVPTDRAMLDLTDLVAVRRTIRTIAPAVIVNAAAYTQVDRAESDGELAYRINAMVPGELAEEAKRLDALLLHYSTDYVFDGNASIPYREVDVAAPLNVYGRSKLAGDVAVLDSGARAWILRIGWVYGNRGHNFLRTVQRLAATGADLRVVADQHGGPSWCGAIASATSSVLGILLAGGDQAPRSAIYHMAPPDTASWYDLATAIVAGTSAGGSTATVTAITTREYPTAAPRPAWSVLDSTRLDQCFGVRLKPWRMQLTECLATADASIDRG